MRCFENYSLSILIRDRTRQLFARLINANRIWQIRVVKTIKRAPGVTFDSVRLQSIELLKSISAAGPVTIAQRYRAVGSPARAHALIAFNVKRDPARANRRRETRFAVNPLESYEITSVPLSSVLPPPGSIFIFFLSRATGFAREPMDSRFRRERDRTRELEEATGRQRHLSRYENAVSRADA